MQVPILQDIIVIFGLSIGVLLFCHKFRIPTIVGFLITGVLSGPHGLGLVKSLNDVQTLADLGIVLLLFSVGMEFSLKKLLEFKRFFILGGILQVSLTALAGFVIAQYLERPFGESIFLGFLLSLSSTAIVLRVYDSFKESDTPHGRVSLGILIFQDIAAVPMMIFTPLLAGTQGNVDGSFLFLLGKGIVILVVVFICAERVVPLLLFYAAKTRSRELFLLSVLVICFSVAFLAQNIGLSLSLGAFLAGLIVSESECRYEALGDILPFRDIFTSFFFVSIGMLLNLHFVIDYPFAVLFGTIGILFLKTSIAALVALLVGMPLRTAILAGIALSQIGEFSFVLANSGIAYGLGTEYHYQLFLSIALLTMGLSPTLIGYGPAIANFLVKIPFPQKIKKGLSNLAHTASEQKKDHLIIIGFGLCGKNVALSCKEANIPYIILEINPITVKTEKEKGEPIYFGDATHESVIQHANIKEAIAVVVLINDPNAALRIVRQAKLLNPKAYLIVRTRYVQEMKTLLELGADDVIPDEFGSSIEIFTRVLKKYHVPAIDVEKIVGNIRNQGYEMQRLFYKSRTTFFDLELNLSDLGIENFRVHVSCPLANKTFQENELRKKYGVTVVTIKRDNQILTELTAETLILPDDILIMVGPQENLTNARKLFNYELT